MNLRQIFALAMVFSCAVTSADNDPKTPIVSKDFETFDTVKATQALDAMVVKPLLSLTDDGLACNLVKASNTELDALANRIDSAFNAFHQYANLTSLGAINVKRKDLLGTARLTYLHTILNRLVEEIQIIGKYDLEQAYNITTFTRVAVEYFNNLPVVSNQNGDALRYWIINGIPVGAKPLLSIRYMEGLRAATLECTSLLSTNRIFTDFSSALKQESDYSPSEITRMEKTLKQLKNNLKTLGYTIDISSIHLHLQNANIEALLKALKLQTQFNKLVKNKQFTDAFFKERALINEKYKALHEKSERDIDREEEAAKIAAAKK